MEKFIIELKDQSKRQFFLELLAQFNFIELKADQEKSKEQEQSYDFFQSAGLFANRNIDANQLRKQAWRIGNR